MSNLKSTLSFFQRLRQRLFRFKVDSEIFGRIMPHNQGESVRNYPFANGDEIAAAIEQIDSRELLDLIEKQIRTMPKGYGRAFRYIMHRDIHARLTMYGRLAQRRVPRQSEIPELARNCI